MKQKYTCIYIRKSKHRGVYRGNRNIPGMPQLYCTRSTYPPSSQTKYLKTTKSFTPGFNFRPAVVQQQQNTAEGKIQGVKSDTLLLSNAPKSSYYCSFGFWRNTKTHASAHGGMLPKKGGRAWQITPRKNILVLNKMIMVRKLPRERAAAAAAAAEARKQKKKSDAGMGQGSLNGPSNAERGALFCCGTEN